MVGPKSAEIEDLKALRRRYPNIMLHALSSVVVHWRIILPGSGNCWPQAEAGVVVEAPIQLLQLPTGWPQDGHGDTWFTAIFVRSSQSRFWGLL